MRLSSSVGLFIVSQPGWHAHALFHGALGEGREASPCPAAPARLVPRGCLRSQNQNPMVWRPVPSSLPLSNGQRQWSTGRRFRVSTPLSVLTPGLLARSSPPSVAQLVLRRLRLRVTGTSRQCAVTGEHPYLTRTCGPVGRSCLFSASLYISVWCGAEITSWLSLSAVICSNKS